MYAPIRAASCAKMRALASARSRALSARSDDVWSFCRITRRINVSLNARALECPAVAPDGR